MQVLKADSYGLEVDKSKFKKFELVCHFCSKLLLVETSSINRAILIAHLHNWKSTSDMKIHACDECAKKPVTKKSFQRYPSAKWGPGFPVDLL